ncbi:type II secretion system F family protein [Paenarthrobacter nitroguajacolicus]|uniref:type II secretion system F family protein n=1 Tax=Paenarthrobacter nitroguajacolicus TaxID=211146 RepID=UPI00248B0C82|nr:type II secretion system F family protein [Paenarthrobacter nitroguajacolicus]MDI2036522.1 hypothetical protein [Paenarthrobacter nitroguajacolicus]
MPGGSILLMMGLLVLASFISFAVPNRDSLLLARVSGLSAGGEAGEIADHGRSGADGLRDTAMMLELVASMLDAGAGLGRALELLARAASPPIARSLRPVVAALAIGADWETAWRTPAQHAPEVLRLKDALAFAAVTGAPSASILYAQAARERREQFRSAEKRAAALGVKLVVPLGLCSLPAFICLGIVPVLIAMIPSG